MQTAELPGTLPRLELLSADERPDLERVLERRELDAGERPTRNATSG